MEICDNTILITGGTSGIGFELAAQLLARGNKLIVTGRSQSNLDAASAALPGIHAVKSDVSDPGSIADLYQHVAEEFPRMKMLINNAGVMRKINLQTAGSDLQDITREIEINLSGSIRMVMQFLPLLKKQNKGAIVNVSSGLAFVPFAISPVYSATKAALHSFTQSLRIQLKNTNVSVFELAPPFTETPLFKDGFQTADFLGVKAMDVHTLARYAIEQIEKDCLEIRPGLSNRLKLMSRVAPDIIFKQLSKSVENMHAEKRD
ncbi:SDR family NAD(P)-dependent oxidoreductase [Bradyrhizobium sp. dw_78]|uniref:SDR family oxidoreductase n=1 Tax=Bradyrhizobium sp. dw_78 TaxID=2719793 RepID=UPI001BD39D69|nr:SDR family NAD(P)-dependent oxidoreductase [Bradyrhizobium sp. dw_78]